ncbi:MAG: CoA transferase [Chloroflexi bacterium]|nr:CoA transferase [Chloroflexota bacterium]
MAPPLQHIRVIDFGQYIAGPLAAMLLADQGADVIRIDPPEGPVWDTPANRTWNRGKRSIALNLKEPGDLETARRLAERADVVIENFRPGVMDWLGLGPAAALAENPRLIYCSLPGFASDDARAGVAAWEGVVGAATGTYRARLEGDRAGRPVYTAIPISSSYAAFLAATSIAAALVARDRDGLGQRLEVPLYDATFTAIGLVGQKVHDPSRVQRRGGLGWVRQYQCKDGRWVLFHAANTRFITQFVQAAGVDWAADGLLDRRRYLEEQSLEGLLVARMEALFLTRTAQEWEDLVNAAGTPTAICRDSAEWLQHPHARASGMVIETDDPVLGTMLQPGVTPRLAATSLTPAPAPLLNADADAIRAELATGSPALPATGRGPTSGAAPLAGLRVLDLCIILAGPTCGRTLAEFGADVIKIDAPAREGGVAFHHDVNRGKRSILLDLKTPAGIEVFWKLVEDADVVVQNYRAGVVEKLGIGYEAVRKRKPGIIYASLNAYGHGGPWEHRPGWEQLAQAATGMQARYGGEGRPVLQPFPVNDYGTGVLGAYAVLLALHQKRATGEGQEVRSALAYTACTLQSAFFADYEGKTWDEPNGQLALGSSSLQRLYEAADGWFFLGARSRDIGGLGEIAGLAGIDSVSPRKVDAFLADRFALASVAEWVERLTAEGVGAHAALSVEEVMEDPWAVAHGLSLTREHDGMGLLRTNGPGQRLSRTPAIPGAPASVPGADAHSVFSEAGLAAQLEALVQAGVVAVEAP